MHATGHGKHMCQALNTINEAANILDEGVAEEISESVALLCADTQLLIAEIEIGRARASMAARMRGLECS